MQFQVASAFTYIVRIVDDLRDSNGNPAYGLCVYHDQEILICSSIRADMRMTTLCHELKHAWHNHVPHAHDDEDDADLLATIMRSTNRDLARQGGEAALARMTVEGGQPMPVLPGGITGDGSICCGKCGTSIARGSIVDGQLVMVGDVPVIDRRVFCEFCDILWSWTEMASSAGQPIGGHVSPPEIVSDAGVKHEFMAEFGHRFGILV